MASLCFQMQPGHLYTRGCKARWEFKWMSKGQTSPFQTGNTAPFLPDLKPVPLFYVVLTKCLNKCRSVKGERLKSTRSSEIKSCFKIDRLLGTLNKIGDFGFKRTRANSRLHQEDQATWNWKRHLGGVEEPQCAAATTGDMGGVGAGGGIRKGYSTYPAPHQQEG